VTRHERIIDEMWRWAELFGAPPAAVDWNAWHRRRWPWRDERYQATGRTWPASQWVVQVFGSWNAALVAAGYRPRPVGRPVGSAYGRDTGPGYVVHHWCRGCFRFVSGPYARCRSCGQEHGRDLRALEEPIRIRRLRARTIPTRKLRR
jgi:hypothetical protein